MTVTATSILATPADTLREMLAACPALRTWFGAADAAEAKLRIHIGGVPEPVADEGFTKAQLESARPLALIHIEPRGGGASFKANAGGARNYFRHTGVLSLIFEADIASANVGNPQDAYLEFINAVGGVLDELMALAATSTYLDLRSLDIAEGPWRVPEDENTGGGDYFFVALSVAWGGGS